MDGLIFTALATVVLVFVLLMVVWYILFYGIPNNRRR
jgi:hypothetical protein